MIMDYKRTCYTTQVRFSPNGPQSTLRWYRCHPKAKKFTAEHIGLSREWYLYREDFGEVRATKVYDKGANTRHKKGQCFLGKPEWYRDGFTSADLAAAGPQQDKCTSCPGKQVKLGIGLISAFQLYYFKHGGPYVWFPWFIHFRVDSPDPAWSGEGYLEANITDDTWIGTATLGTSNVVTWGPCSFFMIFFGGNFAWTGGNRDAQVEVFDTNPLSGSGLNDVLLPGGPPNGTVWSIDAALLVPRITRVSRPAIQFGPGLGKRPARLRIFIGSTMTFGAPVAGGSGYDDGYNDGYGG